MRIYGIEPAYSKNNVAVVCSSDDRYVTFLATMLASLLSHISAENNYDIVILEDGIFDKNKNIIKKINTKRNVSIRFVDMQEYLGDISENWNVHNREKWSKATYYRMLVPYILDKYEKAIYIDCDIINLCDIAEMYSIDVKDYLLGAVRLCGRVVIEQNDMFCRTYVYHKNFLPEVSQEEYFNAGVMLMNLRKFRNVYSEAQMLEFIAGQKYLLQDQDALNVLCAGQVKFIDAGWNWYPYTEKEFGNLSKLISDEYSAYYQQGYARPKNIHYTIQVKPWLEPFGEYTYAASLFWKYAIDLPFREYYIQKFQQFQKEKKNYESLSKRTWEEVRVCAAEGKLYLYGYGQRGKDFLQSHKDITIAGIIDQNPSKKQECTDIPFAELCRIGKNDGIVISPDSYSDIVAQLRDKGFNNLFSYRCLEKREYESWHPDTRDLADIEYAVSLFADERSKRLYLELIKKRQNVLYDRNIKYLDLYEGGTYFRDDFYHITDDEIYVDVGEEKELVVKKFREYTRGKYKEIIHYDGAMLQEVSLDERLQKTNATFIRIYENGIMSVLEGGKELIKNNKPKLAICVSCDYSDLWSVPIFLKKIVPDYNIYLAHHSPNFELTVLYADAAK